MIKRPGTRLIKTLDDGEVCVAMTQFRDTLFVATNKRVYRMVDDQMIPIEFEQEEHNDTLQAPALAGQEDPDQSTGTRPLPAASVSGEDGSGGPEAGHGGFFRSNA